MNAVNGYVDRLFGSAAGVATVRMEDRLPLVYLERYVFSTLRIHHDENLLMAPVDAKTGLQTMLPDRVQIVKLVGKTVALVLSRLSGKERQYLLSHNIPVIVPESLLFLPGEIIAVEEKSHTTIDASKWFSPAEQLVCLALFYRKKNWISGAELAKSLRLSPMSSSRALRRLLLMGALDVSGNAPRIQYRRMDRRAYYDIVKPRIMDPVVIHGSYLNDDFDPKRYRLSGDVALAHQTNLAISNPRRCFAALEDANKVDIGTRVEPYEIHEYEGRTVDIELWSYDPRLLTANDTVDPLSLVASLFVERDNERVDAACRELEERSCAESIDYGII